MRTESFLSKFLARVQEKLSVITQTPDHRGFITMFSSYLWHHIDESCELIVSSVSLTSHSLLLSVLRLMLANLQEKLTDFLPKLLDCSTEIRSFHDPPKLPVYSTLELCERFSRVMSALSSVPSEGRWTESGGRTDGHHSLVIGPAWGRNPWTSLDSHAFLINPGVTRF